MTLFFFYSNDQFITPLVDMVYKNRMVFTSQLKVKVFVRYFLLINSITIQTINKCGDAKMLLVKEGI